LKGGRPTIMKSLHWVWGGGKEKTGSWWKKKRKETTKGTKSPKKGGNLKYKDGTIPPAKAYRTKANILWEERRELR